MIIEAIRWRLKQNDCQNRGYVIDSLPECYKTSFGVFYVVNKKPEPKFVIDENGEQQPVEEMDEETLKEFLRPRFQADIYPDSFIYLRGKFQQIVDRAQSLPSLDKESRDYYFLMNRLNTWWDKNDISLYKTATDPTCFPMTRFFQEHKTEIYEIDFDGVAFEMFDSMRIYIERDGRPYNYLKSMSDLNKKREDVLADEEQKWREANHQEQQTKDTEVKVSQEQLEQLAIKRLEGIKKHCMELEKCDQLNQRQFLMKYIIPVLTEGMIEVCKVGPIDPVDYLSEYIFKRSTEFRDNTV